MRDAAGDVVPAADALADAGIEPLVLREKEGLALINGTDGMLGMLLLALHDLSVLLDTADVAAAMSIESQLGTDAVFAADLMALRPQVGQAASAANLRAVPRRTRRSSRRTGTRQSARACRTRTRCAARRRCTAPRATPSTTPRTIAFARARRRAVDNPVITDDGRVESNGNFHGAPVAYVLDFLAIAVADVASISERRTDRALDPARSHGLPPFLAHEVGVDSGLMIAQYAAAGIVSELKRLAVPASVDSIPSSAMQEDHVSMGWAAARKLRRGIDGLARVLAIEVLTGARAIDLRAPLQPGAATGAVRDLVRTVARGPGHDHFLSPDIEAVTDLVLSGQVAARRRRSSLMTRPTLATRLAATAVRTVRAARGNVRTAKSWGAEAAKRMLMNNLDPEVAEHPEDLVVYGGTGKAARSWEAYDAIVRTLDELEPDETLLVQSGKPVGVFRTHEWAPRVLIANSNLVGDWATWPEFRRLEQLGLTMYGQMTAGSWIYIGTQGILQGTYETFAAVARSLGREDLTGTLTLTGGCGGMGGAQPLAVTLNGGAVLIVDVDESRLARRVEHGYLDEYTTDLDDAVARVVAAKDEGRALSVGVVGNAALVFPELLLRGMPIDIVTDQTSAHDPLAYLPVGVDVEDWARRGRARPRGLHRPRAGQHGQAGRRDGRIPGCRCRRLRLRQLDPRRGAARRLRAGLRVPRLRARVHPAAVRRGPRTVPLGGALGRPRRHPQDRRGRQGAVPRQRRARALARQGRRRRALRGAARPHLLARLPGAPPRRAEVQRDGRLRRARRPHRDRPRPPRRRLGRVAVPRDRGDGRRLRRDRRLAAAERPAQHRDRARRGSRSTTAAASASAAASMPAR